MFLFVNRTWTCSPKFAYPLHSFLGHICAATVACACFARGLAFSVTVLLVRASLVLVQKVFATFVAQGPGETNTVFVEKRAAGEAVYEFGADFGRRVDFIKQRLVDLHWGRTPDPNKYLDASG